VSSPRTAILVAALCAAASPHLLSGQATAVAPRSADAVAELVTDRPDVTESASIVPPGWLQAEAGVSHEEAGIRTFAVPGTLVRIGVAPWVEMRLGWSGLIDREGDCAPGAAAAACETSGAGDAEAGVKVLLVERAGARPDFALIPSVSLPLGDEDVTSDGLDPSLTAAVANDVSSAVGWGVNAGVASVSPGRGPIDERSALAFWSGSLGFDLGERLGSFLEYFGEAPEGEPALHAVDTGFTWLVTPHVQLDASAGVGLTDRSPDLFIGAGLAFRADLFGREEP
jgi:hypothetical protein